jgi:pyruvate dehydrogenase E2 component (dihydrolipoamide acetyltransferase)
MAVEVFMPKMTDHMESGEIIRWLVKEGDAVEQGQILMEVMTDKVVAEFESPATGILKGIRAGAIDGATIPVGETFAFIAAPDEQVPTLPPLKGATAGAAPTTAEAAPTEPAGPAEPGQIRATPAVRKLARELGVDLTQVHGTGPEGRIREEDVRAHLEAQKMTPTEESTGTRASPMARRIARELGVDLAQVPGTGPGGRIREEDVRAFAEAQKRVTVAPPPAATTVTGDTWLDLTPIQRLTGQRMLESVQSAPQFALTVSADMTNALWLREALMERIVAETGERLSVTALLVKIVAAALRQFPRANASFENGRLRLQSQVNVGVAVGTEDGLVVPVIKEADKLSLAQVNAQIKVFQEKARKMRFTNEDLSGGTFTLSNLGMYGIDRFDAIINPPQAAILAVGRAIKTPVAMPDDSIALRPMMNLTLTVDHRAMDGLQGAQFLADIKNRIEKPYFVL